MRKNWKKRIALLLAVMMVCSGFQTAAFADTSVSVLADFTFDDANSGFTGGNAKASGSYTLADSFNAENGKALYLNGSSQFLTVTDVNGGSLLSGKDEITISMDMKQARTATNWAFYAAPNTNQQSWPYEHYLGLMINNGNIKVERYDNNGSRPTCPEAYIGNAWVHVDVVIENGSTIIYVNGVKSASVSSSIALSDILGDSSIIQIGKANWGSGEYYQGWIDNFKIFDGALSESEVLQLNAVADAEVVASAMEQLDIVNKDAVKGNITLPETVAVYGTDKVAAVTWTSSNPAVVTDTEKDGKEAGVVTRQENDTKVTMTATVTCGNAIASKEFVLTIKAKPEEIELTDYLFAFFVNNGGAAEQQIFFASSHDGNNWMDLNKKEAVLSVADSVRSAEDLGKMQNQAGVRDPYLIRSPEGDKFYMIATDLCIGDENIAAGTVGWGTAQYNGSRCLRIWESDDLVNWSEPWLAEVAPTGTTCAWAPEAIYDTATGQYVVYWASMTGSIQKVYYSLTRDFKTFTEPEMFVDNGSDHIIDTTIVKTIEGNYYRGSAASYTIKVEKCNDTSKWLTDQSVWESQGYIRDIAGFSDALEGPELFMYNEDDWKEVNGEKVPTYGLYADNYGNRGYIPFYTTDIEHASWIQTADNDYNFDTLHKRHGTIIGLTAEEYDNIMKAYGPSKITVKSAPTKTQYAATDNSIDGSGLVLTVTYANGKAEDVSYPTSGKNARHFTFSGMDFTKNGAQNVTVTYGEQTATFGITVSGAQDSVTEKSVLAQFDFDDAGSGFSGGNAKATGTYTLTDSFDAENGKALYLNGSSENYLTVTDANGGSLLTGKDEITISMDVKQERTATNWAFYAAPNTDQQSWPYEHYLGLMINNGNLKVERYNNNGSRPTCPESSIGNEWVHIDVVIEDSSTIIYVNGVKSASVSSSIALSDILGSSSIIQIGKANWGSGEYYQGWIDNFTIYSWALSEAELQALHAVADKGVLAQFDFDDTASGFVSENAKAAGTYSLADSYSEAAGKALSLKGSSSNFLTVTNANGGSLLTGASELTISFEAKPATTSTNWPFYAAPNSNAPAYLSSEHYIGCLTNGGTATVERYNQSGARPQSASAAIGTGTWVRVDVVLTESSTALYINGTLKSEVSSAHKIEDILGNASIFQIGKANWGNGEFYNGLLDNVTIYNYALTAEEVKAASASFTDRLPAINGAAVGTAPTGAEANGYNGTDNHTAIVTLVDTQNKVLTPYVRNCADTDVTNIPVTLDLAADVSMTAGGKTFTNGSSLNLSKDVELVLTRTSGTKESWTIKAAVLSNNPVLPGQYADPDIDYFDGKFWIFPTTDGFSGWSGTVFHAWSSEDMVNWTDEGIIMDLANDNPGLNENGIQIASSPWAVGSAWAPSIEEKNGKYYFYYCGKFTNGESAIGVATADSPEGPYVDKGEALMTVSMCRNAGVSMGQAIDPSIFTDDDGRSYLLFGNGAAAIAELNDDMMSIKSGTIKQINGLTDFRESVIVTKANGKYHWTWSCDDTGSPNYHVNYGVSDTLNGNITYIKTLLQKDESKGMLGTAHHSIVNVTDTYGEDRYFIAYHRFYTPLNIYTSGLGYHRETCIDEITFDANGYMAVSPTLEGVPKVTMNAEQAGGSDDSEDSGLTDATLLADFTFDTDGSSFDGGNAVASGSYSLVDHDGGKAISLNGSGQFLTVTKKDGTSLLTGLDEFTVSFRMKPESGGTNWAFFAAPNANQQVYLSEKYLGIFDNYGTVVAERYNSNSQARPARPGYAAGYGNWYDVTVVYTSGATILYINGSEAARESSTVDISTLLGQNSVVYIGKATWLAGGEYYKGLIDDYKIYGRALSAEEVKDAAAN